jgi:hypothetical protein
LYDVTKRRKVFWCKNYMEEFILILGLFDERFTIYFRLHKDSLVIGTFSFEVIYWTRDATPRNLLEAKITYLCIILGRKLPHEPCGLVPIWTRNSCLEQNSVCACKLLSCSMM